MRKWIAWGIVLVLVLWSAVVCAAPTRWGDYLGYPVVRVIFKGKELASDVPAVVVGGRTLVPLRLVSEGFGATVTWDQETYSVSIDQPAPPPIPPRPWPIVLGPQVFKEKMLLTHAVLLSKAPELEKLIRDNVDEIWLGLHTMTSTTGTVMLGDRKWSSLTGLTDMVGLASELVHEATHIADHKAGLSKDNPTPEEDVAEELRADQAERNALIAMGGREDQIKAVDQRIEYVTKNKVGATSESWYQEPASD